MPFDAPFNLGPFAVDSAGRITPRPDNAGSGFLFCWRGRSVHAHMRHQDDGTSQLTLRTSLGRIASTALNRDVDQRARSFAALRALPRNLPDGWRLQLLPDHRMRLEADIVIGLPITISALVTDLSCFLLTLAPYLDLLDEVGVPLGPIWQE